MDRLTRETFLAVAEMVAGHLRLKGEDRWSPHVCRLKFHSFTAEFPEVRDAQLMWAAEQWIQGTSPADFHRFPTWAELMCPLYNSEAGRANRSWGPRSSPPLPAFVAFKPDQLAMLPSAPRSVLAPPDRQNPAAYELVQGGRLMLSPAPELSSAQGLTDEEWQGYLARVAACAEAVETPGSEPCSR